ncbi:hypothetical protein ACOME3_002046 [Neoechinorhynchus agilis]
MNDDQTNFCSLISGSAELNTDGNVSDEADDVLEDVEDLLDVTNEMATDVIKRNLTKQRYHIIGSHSAVKLCRWTKAMMRNRGGCYKHTFYGISSHQCMEMTPSLACANKCVFCWRHNTNPVGTKWRWDTDDPEFIVDRAFFEHRKLVKELRGAKDVDKDQFLDATKRIKHCALSLVGEPIMYPHINRLIDLLHQNGVSTFLVTNGQFPDEVRNLVPVTQLYTSIDASSSNEIGKIDRPLFSDYWQRLLSCLQASSIKPFRTVCRLTLIKGANMKDLDGYGRLVAIAKPDFIEIKGVTYSGCGGSQIRMKDVPWHNEVLDFSKELLRLINMNSLVYEMASEHEHSNCTLLASMKYYINGRWHTWIDFDKFIELTSRREPFTGIEYSKETPNWALYEGSHSRGFDPDQKRFYRNKS